MQSLHPEINRLVFGQKHFDPMAAPSLYLGHAGNPRGTHRSETSET